MDKYIIQLSESLSKGMKQYLADKTQREICEINRHDIANEIFDIILAELDWNLKHKIPEDTSWEFYVTPFEEEKRTCSKIKNNLRYKLKE